MQPSKRRQVPSSPAERPSKIVASYTLGPSGAVPSNPPRQLPAVVEGRVQSVASSGPFVEWSGSSAPTVARVLWMERVPDWSRCIGLRVALAFEDGDERRPIVVGLLESPPIEALQAPPDEPAEVWDPEEAPSSEIPEVLRIESGRELRIVCGKASIHLRADGRIELRGEYLLSRATGPNKIKGGSVQIN